MRESRQWACKRNENRYHSFTVADKTDTIRPRPLTAPPIEARALFNGQREVTIRFRDQVYRLRITRNDKLILTK